MALWVLWLQPGHEVLELTIVRIELSGGLSRSQHVLRSILVHEQSDIAENRFRQDRLARLLCARCLLLPPAGLSRDEAWANSNWNSGGRFSPD